MPYVKQERRPALDNIVHLMIKENIKAEGDLNYILFALCKRSVTPSYNSYKNFLGELHECEEEIRRRFLGPYEEQAKTRNGDIM